MTTSYVATPDFSKKKFSGRLILESTSGRARTEKNTHYVVSGAMLCSMADWQSLNPTSLLQPSPTTKPPLVQEETRRQPLPWPSPQQPTEPLPFLLSRRGSSQALFWEVMRTLQALGQLWGAQGQLSAPSRAMTTTSVLYPCPAGNTHTLRSKGW